MHFSEIFYGNRSVKTMKPFELKVGMHIRNKLTKSRWEVCDIYPDRTKGPSVQIVCIFSSINDEVGKDRHFSMLELSDERMWEIEDEVSPIGKETREMSRHIQQLCNDKITPNKTEIFKLLDETDVANIRKTISSGELKPINTNIHSWIFDVVILEFVEGNRAKAYLNELNDKYMKFTLTNDHCHLTCVKLINNKDEYIKLITSPDEYWDEYIDSFMSKHFRVAEDDEDDV